MADAWKCLYCNWVHPVDIYPGWITQYGLFGLWKRIGTLHNQASPDCKGPVREIVVVPVEDKAQSEVA